MNISTLHLDIFSQIKKALTDLVALLLWCWVTFGYLEELVELAT